MSASAPTTITLVRHGLVHNPKDVFYGRLPYFRLSPEGQRQARAAAEALKQQPVPIGGLYCSPLLRTRQTAAAIAAATGVKPSAARKVIEIRVPHEGTPIEHLIARDWDIYSENRPPFEQPSDVLARARAFIHQALRRHPGGHAVVVTHGDVIAFTLQWALNLPISWQHKAELHLHGLPDPYPQPASITTLTFVENTEDQRPTGIAYVRPY